MINKNILILLMSLIMTLVLLGCNNDELDIKVDSAYTDKVLNPISKEHVIKILESEYGDNISVSTEDIKTIKDEYIVEVYVLLEDSEGTEKHIHKQSLGKHRINMYTGEIIENK